MVPLPVAVSKLLTCLINIILWTIILLIYSIPLAIGFGIRLSVNLVAVKLHPEYIPCSPNDVLVVRDTPDKQPIVNGGILLRVKGNLDFSKFKTLFQEMFLTPANFENYKNFYCDLVKFGGFLFKRVLTQTNVDFEEHFLEKGPEEVDEGNYKKVVASWYQTKYKEGLPLWQVLYFYVPKTDESFVAIKAHHALADGYSFVEILDKLTGSFSPKLGKDKDEEPLGWWNEGKLFLSLPKVALGYLLRHFWFPDNFPKVSYLTEVEMLPMTVGTADLEPIKEIRRKLQVHFPSIIYALQIGTIRRSLLERMKEEELTEFVTLTTSFPVRGHPRNALVNHWSGGTIKIPLRTAQAKDRVLAANASFQQMTSDDGPYLIWKYVSYLNWLFPVWLAYPMSFSNLSLYRYRSSISVMPQSPNQYYLMGQPVLSIYHVPIMKDSFPQAVMLGCSSSHKDQVDFTLLGHPELYPDQASIDRIMHVHFRNELEDLLRLCDLNHEKLNWRE